MPRSPNSTSTCNWNLTKPTAMRIWERLTFLLDALNRRHLLSSKLGHVTWTIRLYTYLVTICRSLKMMRRGCWLKCNGLPANHRPRTCCYLRSPTLRRTTDVHPKRARFLNEPCSRRSAVTRTRLLHSGKQMMPFAKPSSKTRHGLELLLNRPWLSRPDGTCASWRRSPWRELATWHTQRQSRKNWQLGSLWTP